MDLRGATADDHAANPDEAETELDSPMVDVSSSSPMFDETPPPPDNQEGFDSWKRFVSNLNLLKHVKPVETLSMSAQNEYI